LAPAPVVETPATATQRIPRWDDRAAAGERAAGYLGPPPGLPVLESGLARRPPLRVVRAHRRPPPSLPAVSGGTRRPSGGGGSPPPLLAARAMGVPRAVQQSGCLDGGADAGVRPRAAVPTGRVDHRLASALRARPG